MESQLAKIAHVPEDVLHDYSKSKKLTTEEKLAWTAGRQTKEEEDMYYSLIGLFGVHMWLNYGEGAESARQRLVRKIDKLTRQDSRFSQVASWLSASDPMSNFHSARERHEAGTGDWMLQSPQYQQWKQGTSRHLWLYGKAGCGKTVLFSTLADDVRIHCETMPRTGYAMFYFSFSDHRKQSYDDMLRSLVFQLGAEEPALSTLFQAYMRSPQMAPNTQDLAKMLQNCVESYHHVILMLDALDESPDGEVRENVLEHLEQLVMDDKKIQLLTTSREVGAIRDCMMSLAAEQVNLASEVVDGDIRRYVSQELTRDRRLKKLDASMKLLIETELSQRSDGMFRWAYCQLRALKSLKSYKPSHVKATLRSLPATLDETYERMLLNIDKTLRGEALVLLQWLAYAQRPLTLAELVEVNIIDPAGIGMVNLMIVVPLKTHWKFFLDSSQQWVQLMTPAD